jgi:hypothetical protein
LYSGTRVKLAGEMGIEERLNIKGDFSADQA